MGPREREDCLEMWEGMGVLEPQASPERWVFVDEMDLREMKA